MTAVDHPTVVRESMRVSGLVQGVGFRPFVCNCATRRGLSGFVGNDVAGVFIEVQGAPHEIDAFVAEVTAGPPLAVVRHIERSVVACTDDIGFSIETSRGAGDAVTFVAPDSTVCGDCVAEMFDPADRRYRYPFVTCTNCGPRFTITTALPYDRPTTTMAGFELCAPCAAEYADPADRRFHAQPLACADCGPRLWLETPGGTVEGTDAAIAATHRLLAEGAIVAIKGVGGYHLACDARDADAVARLRERKHRPHKPLAVMAAGMPVVEQLAEVDSVEAELLSSAARPIVLLRERAASGLARQVGAGSPLVGAMLPYAPLHHLLFAPVPGAGTQVPEVLVMTSGNLTDEPICTDDDDARTRLGGIADAFVVHDRPIHVPCDDSVTRVVDGAPMPIRRSRGYAPMPLRLPAPTAGLLAVGGELKNTFCLARGQDAWLSQHLGDMGSVATLDAFDTSIDQFRDLYGITPAEVTVDRHPGYHTTAWAHRSAIGPVHEVQHHHAHLAALLAEHERPLDTTIIAAVFDGTGYGDDGTIWGGELLVGGYAQVDRVAHLAPVLLPGGDATIRRPSRSALTHLHRAGIEWSSDLAPVAAARPGELDALARQLDRGLYCVPSTSMGRLFDAVASLIGLRHEATYEAQAAIELEHLAATAGATAPRYRVELSATELDVGAMLAAIVTDLRAGIGTGEIAAAFHDAIAVAIADVAERVRGTTGLATVGLTGGVFQNAVLVAAARRHLLARGFDVLVHRHVPPNDGGLALGQAAVTVARLSEQEL